MATSDPAEQELRSTYLFRKDECYLSPMSNKPKWTNRDASAAETEGWNIFNEDTCAEIQRDDEAAVFPNDEAAIVFVKASLAPHCVKALKIVELAAATT